MSDNLDFISQSNFDDNVMQENQFICLNVKKSKIENKGFRMNERIFREIDKDDVFGVNKKQGKHSELDPLREKSEVVIKLNRQRDADALQISKSQFYLNRQQPKN